MFNFDIDSREIDRIGTELGATKNEIRVSFSRALRRTAGTLRKETSKQLQSELGLRRAKIMRRRLKKFRRKGRRGMDEVKLWFGLNDLPVSEFKGRQSETSTGASKVSETGTHTIEGGFIRRKGGSGSSGGKRTIFRRLKPSARPVAEATIPINDQAVVFIEDEILTKMQDIFWRAFRDDLTRRVAYLRSGT